MSTTAHRLRPWTEVVRPHDDIVEGRLEMSTYAADLGAVDRVDPNTPRVYRDAREFFRTTYPTKNLQRLLADVMDVLGGGAGDRVIQLRTPFGGGKTHSLLALFHLMRSRKEIDSADIKDVPDPENFGVVVYGEDGSLPRIYANVSNTPGRPDVAVLTPEEAGWDGTVVPAPGDKVAKGEVPAWRTRVQPR